MKSRAVSGRPFTTVEIHTQPATVLPIWEALEDVASASIYQTRAFLIPWLETFGAAWRIAPLFIAGKDDQNQPILLLCLGVREAGPLKLATFLGNKASNFDMPLWRPGIAWTRADVDCLLCTATTLLGAAAPDVFALREQPLTWRGSSNPFALLPHQLSPNNVPATLLDVDCKKYFASKLSANARKKLRQHETRLTRRFGVVELISNDTPSRSDAILSAFFAQRTARFRERGINTNFATPCVRAFWTKLARSEPSRGAIEFYALSAGGRILATMAGGSHARCFSAAVNSMDNDRKIASLSPGTLLMNKVIAVQCAKKIEQFDCGPGDAGYKLRYCEQEIALFDAFVPTNMKGRLFSNSYSASLRLKYLIKRNPRLYELMRAAKRSFTARILTRRDARLGDVEHCRASH